METLVKAVRGFFVLPLVLGIGCSDSSTPLAVPVDGVALKAGQEVLPQHIIDAVKAEKPEGTLVAAFKEKEKGKTVYEVEVEMPDGSRYEVEVNTDGKVLEVETSDGGEGDEGNQAVDLPPVAGDTNQ